MAYQPGYRFKTNGEIYDRQWIHIFGCDKRVQMNSEQRIVLRWCDDEEVTVVEYKPDCALKVRTHDGIEGWLG